MRTTRQGEKLHVDLRQSDRRNEPKRHILIDSRPRRNSNVVYTTQRRGVGRGFYLSTYEKQSYE